MAVKEFSVQEKLISICTLQKIDSKIDEINKLRGELPMEVRDLEDELEGYNMRMNAIENEILIIKEDIKRKKNIQVEAAEVLKKYEKQQNNVKNSREFEAIDKEIENQELEIKAAEKKIKDAKYAIAEQEKIEENTKNVIAEKQEILKIKKAELKKIIEETEVEEKELLKKRDVATQQVEPRLLSAYEKIRNNYRNGLAVAVVDRDSCGGCFNVVPPQRQSEIRLHKKMIVCEHCGRILVDNELVQGIEI